MADKTIIAWTEKTFNAAWGCVKISPGCKNCYADTLSRRYGHDVWGPNKPRRILSDKNWGEPLKWQMQAEKEGRRIRVFCGSMFDWGEDHPTINGLRPRIHDLWRQTPLLDWQMLTKRAERLPELLPPDWGNGYANVWLGVSIENNDYVGRADALRKVPATVHFISYEPALGPLDKLDLTGIDWVIQGGESGSGFRPMELDWARHMQSRCAVAGVAYFFKQSAAYRTEMGVTLDGRIVRNYPQPTIPFPPQWNLAG